MWVQTHHIVYHAGGEEGAELVLHTPPLLTICSFTAIGPGHLHSLAREALSQAVFWEAVTLPLWGRTLKVLLLGEMDGVTVNNIGALS